MITPADWMYLDALREHGPQGVNDLASRVDREQPSTSLAVQRLVRKGLVSVERNPRDGRRRIVRLTGRAISAADRRVEVRHEPHAFLDDHGDGFVPVLGCSCGWSAISGAPWWDHVVRPG